MQEGARERVLLADEALDQLAQRDVLGDRLGLDPAERAARRVAAALAALRLEAAAAERVAARRGGILSEADTASLR